MGRLGVPTCCYNFMPDDDWSLTSFKTLWRALVSSHNLNLDDHESIGLGGPFAEDHL